MKLFFAGCALFLILLVGLCAWIFSSRGTSQTPSPTATTTPTFPNSPALAPQDPVVESQVKNAFLGSIQHSDQISLKNAVIVMPYAIQNWQDTNKGGEALLKYDSASGWVLLSLGGGAWDVPSLVDSGVPQSIAQELIAQEPQ